MKKIILSFIFSVLFLVPFVAQEASAASMTFTTDTIITTSMTINAGETWTINPGVTLTIDTGVTITNNGFIQVGQVGTLVNNGMIKNFGTLQSAGKIENKGVIENEDLFNVSNIPDSIDPIAIPVVNTGTIINNGEWNSSGDIFNFKNIVNNGIFNNNRNGVFNHGVLDNNGTYRVEWQFVNECTGVVNISSNGVMINAASFENKNVINNLGILEVIANRSLFNAGTIIGNPVTGEGIVQTGSSQCEISQIIGGKVIPIESASLLLVGANSFSWMIPVTLSILGIGLFIASRKDEN